jgi:hypothetical protein
MEMSGQLHAPVVLPPGKNRGTVTHRTGGWVGPKGEKISHPYRDSNPRSSYLTSDKNNICEDNITKTNTSERIISLPVFSLISCNEIMKLLTYDNFKNIHSSILLLASIFARMHTWRHIPDDLSAQLVHLRHVTILTSVCLVFSRPSTRASRW